MTSVAPRSVTDVSYVARINQESHFLRQVRLFREVQLSFFVAGALFGENQVSLFVAGALLGEVQVSLVVAGALFGEIWNDSRSAKC